MRKRSKLVGKAPDAGASGANNVVIKLVTPNVEDTELVLETLHGTLALAKRMQATEVIIIARNREGEVFSQGHWTDEDRMIGMLESVKFELLSEMLYPDDLDDNE